MSDPKQTKPSDDEKDRRRAALYALPADPKAVDFGGVIAEEVDLGGMTKAFATASDNDQEVEARRSLDSMNGRSRAAARVYIDVQAERIRQDAKWGGPEHDDGHTLLEWLNFIEAREVVLRCVPCLIRDKPLRDQMPAVIEQDRKLLIEIAALAVAAVESLDRKSR